MQGCEVVWAIRHSSICHTFVDEGAAVFFLPHLEDVPSRRAEESASGPVKRTRYVYDTPPKEEKRAEGGAEGGAESEGRGCAGVGSALGPDWQSGRQMKGGREV